MNKKLCINITVVSVVFLLVLFFSSKNVDAFFYYGTGLQGSNSSTCQVSSVNIRHNITDIPDPTGDDDGDGHTNFQENFFHDNNRPFVYFDIETTGCLDLDTLYDIRFTVQNILLHVDVPQSSFTMIYLAGEGLGCSDDLCTYQAIVKDANNTDETMGTPPLVYENDGSLDTQWTFEGWVPYGQNHPDDTTGIVPPTSPGSGQGLNNAYLAPLPGLAGQPAGLKGFLEGLFQVLIIIAGILAVIMIVLGAITYLSSDAISGKSSGKEMMLNAVLGLILALGAWVILNTINPDLASELDITIPEVNLGGYNFDENGVVVVTGGSACADPTPQVPNCPTCQTISSTIQVDSSGGTITPALNSKLVSLQSSLTTAGISWAITEAFPPTPTVHHCSSCHYNGTCVDANLRPPTAITTENIIAFINAAKASGLRPQYETASQTTVDALVAAGLVYGKNGDVIRWSAITAPHFSVYNQ